jgi:hypothetical protein
MDDERRVMFDWIRGELAKRFGSFEKLKMHISVVLDELGATNGFLKFCPTSK